MGITDTINNMAIGKKLLGGFGLVLLLTVILGVVAYVETTAMTEEMEIMAIAAQLEVGILEARQQEKNYLIREDQESIDKWTDIEEHIAKEVNELNKRVTDTHDLEHIATIRENQIKYKDII